MAADTLGKKTMSDTSLCFQTAVELARMMRGKEVSAREVMEAHLARIETEIFLRAAATGMEQVDD